MHAKCQTSFEAESNILTHSLIKTPPMPAEGRYLHTKVAFFPIKYLYIIKLLIIHLLCR